MLKLAPGIVEEIGDRSFSLINCVLHSWTQVLDIIYSIVDGAFRLLDRDGVSIVTVLVVVPMVVFLLGLGREAHQGTQQDG